MPIKGKKRPIKKKPIKGKKRLIKKTPIKGKKRPIKKKPIKGKKRPIKKKPIKGKKRPIKKRPIKGKKRPIKKKPIKGKKRPIKKKPIKGKKRLIKGDALTQLKHIRSESVQSVIADPPYFNVLEEAWDQQWSDETEYIAWTCQWIELAMKTLKNNGLLFCFGQTGKREHVFIPVMAALCQRFQYHDLLIWDRAVGYNERRDSFTPAYEMILVLRKSDKVKFNKDAIRIAYPEKTISQYMKDKRYKNKEARILHLRKGKFSTNILRTPSLKGSSKEKYGHPSQKPLELIMQLILCSTDKSDTVLDPFIGSGTTAIAAERLERKWIGIEKDKHFLSMVKHRLKEENCLLNLTG